METRAASRRGTHSAPTHEYLFIIKAHVVQEGTISERKGTGTEHGAGTGDACGLPRLVTGQPPADTWPPSLVNEGENIISGLGDDDRAVCTASLCETRQRMYPSLAVARGPCCIRHPHKRIAQSVEVHHIPAAGTEL